MAIETSGNSGELHRAIDVLNIAEANRARSAEALRDLWKPD